MSKVKPIATREQNVFFSHTHNDQSNTTPSFVGKNNFNNSSKRSSSHGICRRCLSYRPHLVTPPPNVVTLSQSAGIVVTRPISVAVALKNEFNANRKKNTKEHTKSAAARIVGRTSRSERRREVYSLAFCGSCPLSKTSRRV